MAAYPVGSTVDGEVVSFTSHGAMVDVPLPDGGGALHCYIPLAAMGTPPPTKARQMLKKGEVRPFVLAGLDPPRRVAELALPPPSSPTKRGPWTKVAAPAKKAPAKRATTATKAPAKKATPPKKAAKKAAEPVKKAAAKKTSAKKSVKAKKAPANKAAKARRS